MKIRRREVKIERIPSDDLENQGEGTWIEVRKKLAFQHLRPMIELAAWRDDPRIKGEAGAEAQVEAMNELMDSFGVALYPLVLNWNWVSDMEAELAAKPEMIVGRIKLQLETPIWQGSDFRITGDAGTPGAPEFSADHPIYLGNYPDDYQELALESVSDDGRVLVCRGDLTREYEPGAHYVVAGLPAPDGPEAFGWLGLEEMMWIVDRIAQRFQAEMKRQESGRSPKASG